MTDKTARVCDHCGKADILDREIDSNGMVIFQGEGSFLLMRPLWDKESSRPSLAMTKKAFCQPCLPAAIEQWLNKVR